MFWFFVHLPKLEFTCCRQCPAECMWWLEFVQIAPRVQISWTGKSNLLQLHAKKKSTTRNANYFNFNAAMCFLSCLHMFKEAINARKFICFVSGIPVIRHAGLLCTSTKNYVIYYSQKFRRRFLSGTFKGPKCSSEIHTHVKGSQYARMPVTLRK